MVNKFRIKNASLEVGYSLDEKKRVITETALFDILIENKKIVEIVHSSRNNSQNNLSTFDAKGKLVLPNFKDMHLHLDKTYYGGPWKACIPFENIFTRIKEEEELLPKLQPTVQERAETLFQLLLSNGITEVRTHCNIDQVVGLKNLEATLKASENYSDKLLCKIVAFPQHGLLRSDVVSLMREAMQNGADFVGGLDPGNVDLDIERSLQTMFELAVDSNSDIDIHLHDPGHLGLFTMNRIADITEEAGWKDRVTISHAIGLNAINNQELEEVALKFNNLGINIASVVSARNNSSLIPIPTLKEYGVETILGTDTIRDHWSPFGQGNVLEKLTGMAEYFRFLDEKSLSQSLGYITGGITPLDKDGSRVWPNVGDKANFNFFDAECSAEVVARKPQCAAVIYEGKVLSEN